MSGKARIGIRHLLGLVVATSIMLVSSAFPAAALSSGVTVPAAALSSGVTVPAGVLSSGVTVPADVLSDGVSLARQVTANHATVNQLAANETTAGVSDSIVRLYVAIFDRLPDPDGKAHWVGAYQQGVPLSQIAGAFMASTEWTQTYGTVDDDRFVNLLYANVLDRAADPEGLAYWRTTVQSGTRAELLVYFSESDEFVVKTATASPLAPALAVPVPPADSGVGRRIVYANSAQRVWLINDDGSVHDSYEVSGRRVTPGPGVYSVFSKSPKAYAGHDGITMNHMVRFARGRRLAIGFHSIPAYRGGRLMQTLDQLGTYQSAGCVRQSADKAEALYHWAPVGTTVVVLP